VRICVVFLFSFTFFCIALASPLRFRRTTERQQVAVQHSKRSLASGHRPNLAGQQRNGSVFEIAEYRLTVGDIFELFIFVSECFVCEKREKNQASEEYLQTKLVVKVQKSKLPKVSKENLKMKITN